eukprot:1937816-Pyramimonas_sp.AAC.1
MAHPAHGADGSCRFFLPDGPDILRRGLDQQPRPPVSASRCHPAHTEVQDTQAGPARVANNTRCQATGSRATPLGGPVYSYRADADSEGAQMGS